MSVTNTWMLGCVVTAAGQINQIQDVQPNMGIETALMTGDGQVDMQFAAITKIAPRMKFTTTALSRALTIAALSGYAIAADVEYWFQKVAAGGTRVGSTSSQKLVGAKGILVPMSISADDGQAAKLVMDTVFVSSDGTTAPVTGTTGATLPSLTAYDQCWTCGPVSMNGSTIEGIQNVNVDFGFDLVVKGGSGEVYPTFVGIKRRKPVITFRTTDLSILFAAGGHVAQGATDSIVYLRKMSKNGTRVAAATTEHIKFTIDDGLFTAKQLGGGADGEDQLTEVTIEPTWDGTNDVIAISLATAIA